MTIRKPRGNMTRPLTTAYHVGDKVVLNCDLGDDAPHFPHVGEAGVIRRILVSDPNDGDKTFLNFDVKWAKSGRIVNVGADEIMPAKSAAWLRRQLATLNVEPNERRR